jgi:N-acetylmuramoyl-L-alanine amidase
VVKKITASILLLTLFFIFNPLNGEASTNRISGKDRFEVAVNISNKGWSNSDTVILANYNAFADALSSSPLAYKYNAPILLTHPTSLTPVTKKEITRLRAKKVVIVGGTSSISNNVITELKNMGINSERIGGKDRYEVSLNISKHLGNKGTAIIAYGLNFPDALAIAPYASQREYPILLTKSNELPLQTKEALKTKGISKTVVVGGEASVGNKVYSQLPSPIRIGGKDRFEVAANIIRTLNLPTNNIHLATGMTFADALTGSVLAAKTNSPILLTNATSLPLATQKIIKDKKITNFTILGGNASVSEKLTYLLGKVIVLDPGHGGHDPGAIGNGLEEKEVVLNVGLRVEKKLQSSGAIVVMTRKNDTFLTLDERAQIGNNSNASTFVSIHTNSFSTSSPNGSETYWSSNYYGANSKELATEIQKELVKKLGTTDRGVKEAGFYVIKYTKIPSVLVELGFISNKSDAVKLASSTYRDKAADAIVQGLINYYN